VNLFICVDLERLRVLYKNPDQAAVMNLANIEVPESAIVVMSATDAGSYERFTDYELKVLFSNICGMQHDGFHRGGLIQSVTRLVSMLPETQLRASEVEAQLLSIKEPEQGGYRYQYGSTLPLQQQELFVPDGLVSVPGHKAPNKRYYVRPANKVHAYIDKVGVNPHIVEPDVPTPRDPSTPREVSARPAAGSKTERVWAISDECYAKHPHLDKQLRALVAAACKADGINDSTMSVQFSKWKHSKANS
jgi:hypothetical protein